MGTILKTSWLAAAVLVGLFAGPANAQDIVDAKIPFSFVVGNEELPAGRYQFTISQALLTIRGQDNERGIFALTNAAGGHDPNGDEPVLVFEQYEKTYRLTDIWNSENHGAALVMHRDPKSAHQVASSTDTVLIKVTTNEAKGLDDTW
jgi:hypothetical protein